MSQIALPLDIAASSKDGGYLVTETNIHVHNQLDDWKSWPNHTAILIGPKSSGKTAMAGQFERSSKGLVLDDADNRDAETIFHLWNRALEEQKPLLLTATKPVAKWNVALPDLRSRLAASLMLKIATPDESMIEGLLQQYFAKRSISISEDAVVYLSKRMERSYDNVEHLAHKMNMIALERKKSITLFIAKAALDDWSNQSDDAHSQEFDF